MSLEARLSALVVAVANKIKPLQTAQGNLATLTTTEKTSLVGAINELQVALETAGGGVIDDAATAGDNTWSAAKIIAELGTLRASLLDGVDPAWDTFLEMRDGLADQESALALLLNAVGNRVRYDEAMALTAPQQAQACANIGVGNPEVDLVTLFEAQFAA